MRVKTSRSYLYLTARGGGRVSIRPFGNKFDGTDCCARNSFHRSQESILSSQYRAFQTPKVALAENNANIEHSDRRSQLKMAPGAQRAALPANCAPVFHPTHLRSTSHASGLRPQWFDLCNCGFGVRLDRMRQPSPRGVEIAFAKIRRRVPPRGGPPPSRSASPANAARRSSERLPRPRHGRPSASPLRRSRGCRRPVLRAGADLGALGP